MAYNRIYTIEFLHPHPAPPIPMVQTMHEDEDDFDRYEGTTQDHDKAATVETAHIYT